MLEKERARYVPAMTKRSSGIIWISFGDTPQLISRWFFRDSPFMMHSEGSRSRVESYCRGAGGSYNPKSSLHFLFLARGMKIGWSAAPKQLCRLPVLVVVLSRRLLAVPSGFYIDDLQVVETLVSRGLSTGLLGFGDFPGSAHSTLVEITTVFTPVSDPRRLMWLPVPTALGVQTDFSSTHPDGVVRQRVAPQTRSKSLALVQQVLGSGEFSPSLVGSLRVVTGCFTGLVFHVPLSSIPPVVVLFNASLSPAIPPSLIGSGRVAFVVFVPGRDLVFWAVQDVPEAALLRLHGFSCSVDLYYPIGGHFHVQSSVLSGSRGLFSWS